MSKEMNKEEIVRNLSDGWVGGMTLGDEQRIVYPAMDKWAEIRSIAFLDWAFYNRWYNYVDGKWRYTFEMGTSMSKANYEKNYTKTTEQLYKIFLKESKI